MTSKSEHLKIIGTASVDLKKMGQQDEVQPENVFSESNEWATQYDLKQLHRRIEQMEQYCLNLEIVLSTILQTPVSSLNEGVRGIFSSKKKEPEAEVVVDQTEVNINAFVESLLADKKTNIGILPDYLERKLDRRILTLVIEALNKTLKTASVEVCDGHKLTFDLKPTVIEDQGLNGAEGIESVEGAEQKKKKTLDRIVFTALKEILSTAKINFVGQQLTFNLE